MSFSYTSKFINFIAILVFRHDSNNSSHKTLLCQLQKIINLSQQDDNIMALSLPISICSAQAIPYPTVFSAEVTSLDAALVANYSSFVYEGYYRNHRSINVTNVTFCNVTHGMDECWVWVVGISPFLDWDDWSSGGRVQRSHNGPWTYSHGSCGLCSLKP
jgi:hypothetical protein